ncbi:MAG: hypothetical protein HYX34_15375 [Actinobacteria bacterium]|nr:hypothetical protein [Actinomycetota bacterium]
MRLLTLAVAAGLFVAGGLPAAAATPAAGLLSTNPDDVTPHVLDGQVNAVVDLGSRVIVGGTFTQVKKWSSPAILPRLGIFAYSKATGDIDPTFRPDLGTVRAMVAAPDGRGVVVGGIFSTVAGARRGGLVEIDALTGAPVTGFAATTDGRVNTLALVGDRLFVGGLFGHVSGVDRSNLAAVDGRSGALDPTVDVPVAVPTRDVAQVWRMAASPDGRRLVIVGNFQMVGGQSRSQVAVLDIASTPALPTAWQTRWFDYGGCSTRVDFYVKDVSVDPAGRYFVVAAVGSWGTGTAGTCDSVTRWELGSEAPAQDPTWREYSGGDSYWAVAATTAAVYVAGHIRWANNALAGRGDVAGPGAVDRVGIAALDPQSGLPLSWNIQRERGIQVGTLTVTPGGMYIGSDSSMLGNEWHPRLAFLPFDATAAPAQAVATTLPTTLTVFRADGTRLVRPFDGTLIGPQQLLRDDGTGWAQVRGVVRAANRTFRVRQDGRFEVSTDGRSWTAWPMWSDGTGRFTDLTGAAYLDGKLYYTVAGSGTLLARGFSPDSGLLGGLTYEVSGPGVDLTGAHGLASAGGSLYVVDRTNTLDRITLSSATGLARATALTRVSGPWIDWVNWSAAVGLQAG